jgi:surface protein
MNRLIIVLSIFIIGKLNAQTPFISTWKTDNPGLSDDFSVIIPLALQNYYDFTIEWGDNSTQSFVGFGEALLVNHTYANSGIYTITINGAFPRIYFNNSGDRQKLLNIEQWGENEWSSFENSFYGCSNLQISAIDAPNLSSTTNLNSMFRNCTSFNGQINFWDVTNVTDMSHLFEWATSFNQSIETWNVSSVTNMQGMFSDSYSFNQPIDNWDVSNVTNMASMFRFTNYNQPLNSWVVSNVSDMSNMFSGATSFNQPLNNWDVSNVINMSGMFSGAQSFNQPLNNWNVSNVTIMNSMFSGCHSFNQSINSWDVSNVNSMTAMFSSAYVFNQPLDLWDVSNVNSMFNFFWNAYEFDQSLETWDVSNVTNMTRMFRMANSFNQPIDNWDVSSVTTMESMFRQTNSFSQSLNNWDVSNVENMKDMFLQNLAFDFTVGTWNVNSLTDASNMFNNSNLSPCNYDSTLVGWSQQELQLNVSFGVQGLYYTQIGVDAKQSIIDNYGWQIFGDQFVAIPELVVSSEVNGTEISIFASEGLGDYTYSWTGPNGFASTDSSIVAPQNGTYTVIVSDGCNQWTETFEILTVGISPSETDIFQLFPNPTTGLVYGFSNSSEYSKIQVFDLNGKQVFESDFSSNQISIDLGHLETGMYLSKVLDKKGMEKAKQRICIIR